MSQVLIADRPFLVWVRWGALDPMQESNLTDSVRLPRLREYFWVCRFAVSIQLIRDPFHLTNRSAFAGVNPPLLSLSDATAQSPYRLTSSTGAEARGDDFSPLCRPALSPGSAP